MQQDRLRLGILCQGYSWPESSLNMVRSMLQLPGVSLELLVFNRTPPSTTTRWQKIKKVLTGRGLLWGLRNRWFNKPTAEVSFDMQQEWKHIPMLEVTAVQKGKFTQLLQDEDIESLKQYNLDVLLKFSFGILRGKVLTVARYGIWSFHHGDPQQYRGGPPGFWEVHDGSPTTSAILQRLTEKLDGGIILQQCTAQTVLTSAARNYERIQAVASHLPVAACRDILNGRLKAVNSAPVVTNAPIKVAPTDWQYLRYWWRTRYRRWKARLRYLFTDEIWAIGLIKEPIHRLLEPDFVPTVQWITAERPHQFLADPFAYKCNDQLRTVAEQFDYQRGNGQIVSIPIADNGKAGTPQVDLNTGTHLSYPCTVYDGKHWYMIPENIEQQRLVLYQLQPDNSWKEYAAIPTGETVIDPRLFQHKNRWWLMGTSIRHADTELLAWHAESLTGSWYAHAANTIKLDPRSSRPAGTPFVHHGVLYRPAQNNSMTYGGSVMLNRVDCLTPELFAETPLREIKPQPDWPFHDGLHTISSAGEWTVIDAKKVKFAPSRIMTKIFQRFTS